MKRSGKRPYELKARAVRREEVHLRITKATVDLHRSVGPAKTTVSEIAKRAGVRRATVYNHFPSDRELIDACSSHWFSENPPPDPAPWTEISDPSRRAVVALTAMYSYYESGKQMLENVLRDGPQVPALEEILELKWGPLLEGVAAILSEGRERPGPDSNTTNVALRASLNVALDFFTWKTLTSSGLSNERAARLAAAWIETGDKPAM